MTKNILLIMPQDTSWLYATGHAFLDGLMENGHRCTVLPGGYLERAPELLPGARFDQAWIWVDSRPLGEMGRWLEGVAPVRVGLIMGRLPSGLGDLGGFTHALTAWPEDAVTLRGALGIPALRHMPMVPERFIRPDLPPDGQGAVGLGFDPIPGAPLPLLPMDAPNLAASSHGDTGMPFGSQDLPGVEAIAARLHSQAGEALIRELDACRKGFATVHPSSDIGSPCVRLAESMAAGAPTLVPDAGPEMAAAFPEALWFHAPQDLTLALDRLRNDPEARLRISTGARNTLSVRHTSRIRLRQYEIWIDQGVAPDFARDLTYKPDVDESFYYRKFFGEDPLWSKPEPNADERCRWNKIRLFMDDLRETQGGPMELLEVGCGRGWLSNLCAAYGNLLGIEPVGDVVARARAMFPHVRFLVGSADLLTFLGHAERYDALVCSEVIEHVPDAIKPAFVRTLVDLVRPGGHLILTTPRKDILAEWTALCGAAAQPTEDWLTEAELRMLLENEGCTALRLERAYDLDIYQIWLFRRDRPAAMELPR